MSHAAHLLKIRHVWRCFQDRGYIIEWLENSPLWVSIKHGSSSTNQCTGIVIWSWDHVYSTRHGWHQRANLGCERSVLTESLCLPAVTTVQLFSCQYNIFLLGGGQGREGERSECTKAWCRCDMDGDHRCGTAVSTYTQEDALLWMALIRDKHCSSSALPEISLNSTI